MDDYTKCATSNVTPITRSSSSQGKHLTRRFSMNTYLIYLISSTVSKTLDSWIFRGSLWFTSYVYTSMITIWTGFHSQHEWLHDTAQGFHDLGDMYLRGFLVILHSFSTCGQKDFWQGFIASDYVGSTTVLSL